MSEIIDDVVLKNWSKIRSRNFLQNLKIFKNKKVIESAKFTVHILYMSFMIHKC